MRNATSGLKLLMLCFYAMVKGLEELVVLQAVYLETSLYPSVRYEVTALEHWTNETMVCVWSTFIGQTFTSEHTVLSNSPVCFQDPAGVMPVDTDVHGAYLVSAAVVQRGAVLINEESRLSTITDMALALENMDIKKLSTPTQLMRDNLMAMNASEPSILSTSADEAVRQVLLMPTQDPYKLRLSYRVQQHMGPCNPNQCSKQLYELQSNARWPQVTRRSIANLGCACRC
jgi:hypothetical protein